MTIANAKRILSLLCLLCLIFALPSCRTDTDLLPLHSLSNNEGEDPGDPIAEYYTLVLPADAGEQLAARAKELAVAITEKTSVFSEVVYDNETIPKRENARLILLGYTNHSLSSLHLSALKRDDYVCTLDDTTLILGGKSDEATLAAIERFYREVLPYADAEILINNDRFFTVRETYAIESVTLNGYSLADYTLVYPSGNKKGEKQIAYALRKAIADRCGFYPEIISGKKLENPVRMIAVGDCFDIENADVPSIQANGSLVSLCGGTPYELACTAEAFCNRLTPPDATDSVTLELLETVAVSCPSLECNVSPFSLNVSDTPSPNDLVEITAASTAIQDHNVAVASFGAITAGLCDRLAVNLTDYTAFITDLPGTQRLPLYYDASLVSLAGSSWLNSGAGLATAFHFTLADSALSFTLIQLYTENAENAETLIALALRYADAQSDPCVIVLHTPSIPDEGFSCERFSISATVSGTQSDAFVACIKAEGVVSTRIENTNTIRLQFVHPYLR